MTLEATVIVVVMVCFVVDVVDIVVVVVVQLVVADHIIFSCNHLMLL